jgi:3-(3-hydroxy-phenyl)propionate hydroxylase
MSMRKHWPVIVVGAGPTGLTTANLLAQYGVEVLLIERNTSTVQEPRAVSIDDESLRTMQAVGVINDLLPNIVLGYGSEYFSPGRRRFLKVKPTTLEYGYPRRNAFRQPVLEALLRKRLADHKYATARFETELVGLSQFEAGVTVTLRSADRGSHDVTCDYLIGCDGSRSFVRQRLDVAMEGSTFNERWLIIDLEGTCDRSRDTKVYCNPSRPCLSLPGPHGTRRFEFMLHKGEADEQALCPEYVARLLHAHGEGHEATLRRKVVYAFHARMAARWRCGRVFLAGDAAHLMPPFAGQGMNSGMRDAHNLAWKVAAVVKRELGPALLNTYEAERRGHAAEMIELAVRMGHVMMPRTRARAFALQMFFSVLALYPPARSYFAEMKYKPKPRFRQGFLINNSGHSHERSLVGTLFPQALVATPSGYQLLDDVLGDGFSLVAPPGTSTKLLQGTVDAARVLKARLVAVLGKEDTSTAADPIVVVRDVRGDIATLLAPYSSGLYLLRPDRYVAACVAPHQLGTMWKDIEMLCASTLECTDSPPSSVHRAVSAEAVGP